MNTLQMPSTDHTEFDQICERVDEFDHLPAFMGDPMEPDRETADDAERDASLNGLILAGLVSPH